MSGRGRAAWTRWAVPLTGATVFAAAAAWYILGFMPQQLRLGERMILQGLQLRAEIRGNVVARWLQDGRLDTSWWAVAPTIVGLARGGRPTAERAHGREILRSFARLKHYRRAYLLDAELRRITSTDTAALELSDTGVARDVLRTGVPRVAFQRHADGRPGVTFYAAVHDSTRRGTAYGLMAFEVDPAEELFEYFGTPIAGLPTGRALLAARAGDSLVVISPLSDHPAPPGTLRRPLSAADLPAAVALRGGPTRGRFVDLRGVPVLAATVPLPEADWGLVVEVDQTASLGPVTRGLILNGLLWGLAILATCGAALAGWWGQRRSADAKLARSLARNALLLDQANDAILLAGLDGRIREANQRADALYGYAPGGLVGRRLSDLVAEEQREAFGEHVATLERDGQLVGESVHCSASGARFTVEVSARRVEVETQVEVVALVRDISERKAAEARIARLNSALRTLRGIDELILREHDPQRLRSEACRILVEQGGLAIAWIGVAEPDGRIRPVAWAGALGELITTVQVRWDDTPEGRGPAGTAIREDRTVTVRESATDERTAAWRALLSQHRVSSMLSVPIRWGAAERDVLAVQSLEADAFDGDVLGTMEELAGDLGYALQALAERNARRAAEQRLAAFFTSDLFGTTIGGVHGGIVDANDAFLRMVGYTREDLREGRLDWRDLTPPEFRPLEEAALLEAQARGACTPYEKQYVRKDGSRVWVLIGYILLGEPREESVAFILDISERKLAEETRGAMARQRDAVLERLRLQVERMPIALILESPDRVVVDWNPAAERMFGYSRDEALGRHSAELIRSEESPAVAQAFVAEVAASGRTAYAVREAHTRDGRRITCAWHATALRTGAGELTGILWMAEDVTDRTLAAEALRRSEESLRVLNLGLEQRVADRTVRLEVANRELETFSSSISHDLRGPLRAVDGYSQILLEEYAALLDGKGRRYLDVIRANTQRMGEMIADLLKFSRVGRQEMIPAQLDMVALVKAVWFEMTTGDQRERIALRVDALPRAVGDGSLLRQVWMQLLANAEKFTRPKAQRTIDVGFREEPGRTVYCVRDNGVGFETERAAGLFTVFQRLHPAGEFEGTGVGLALVQRIVHRHGGSVWAEGVVGEGATFSFSLPAGESAETA